MAEENEPNRDNLEICPNCLEPNAKDLANCAYCGMPLRPQTSENGQIIESPEAKTSGEETPEHEAEKNESAPPQKPEKKTNTWTKVMRGMGLYLIVYSIMEMPRSFQLENPNDRTLSIISNVIYLVAGGMLAWPMLKEYLAKRKEKQQGEGDSTIIEGEIKSEDEDKVEAASESSGEVNLDDSANEEVASEEISEVSNDSVEENSPTASSDHSDEPESTSDADDNLEG